MQSGKAVTDTVLALWREVLGAGVATETSFIAAGGDSFLAVMLTVRLFEELGCEIDYLDVLQAGTVTDVVRAVRSAEGGNGR